MFYDNMEILQLAFGKKTKEVFKSMERNEYAIKNRRTAVMIHGKRGITKLYFLPLDLVQIISEYYRRSIIVEQLNRVVFNFTIKRLPSVCFDIKSQLNHLIQTHMEIQHTLYNKIDTLRQLAIRDTQLIWRPRKCRLLLFNSYTLCIDKKKSGHYYILITPLEFSLSYHTLSIRRLNISFVAILKVIDLMKRDYQGYQLSWEYPSLFQRNLPIDECISKIDKILNL